MIVFVVCFSDCWVARGVEREGGEHKKSAQTFLPKHEEKNRSEKQKKSLTPIQSNTNGSSRKKTNEKEEKNCSEKLCNFFSSPL